MKLSIETLSEVKKVSVSPLLWDKIASKTVQQQVVSISWARAVAAMFVALFAFECYLFVDFSPKKQQNTVKILIDLPNNSLYYE